MKFLVSIERDEDGAGVVECPAIPGCVSEGESKDAARTNILDAIRAQTHAKPFLHFLDRLDTLDGPGDDRVTRDRRDNGWTEHGLPRAQRATRSRRTGTRASPPAWWPPTSRWRPSTTEVYQ